MAVHTHGVRELRQFLCGFLATLLSELSSLHSPHYALQKNLEFDAVITLNDEHMRAQILLQFWVATVWPWPTTLCSLVV